MPGRDQVRAAPLFDLNYASLLARLGARRKLLIFLQPRDNPLPFLLLAGMNHHLRRPLFLRHCLVFSRRADHLESVAHDDTRNFSMGGTRKYDDPAHMRAEKAAAYNMDFSIDPLSTGRTDYDNTNRKKAVCAATAQDVSVRSHFAHHGIGKAAI